MPGLLAPNKLSACVGKLAAWYSLQLKVVMAREIRVNSEHRLESIYIPVHNRSTGTEFSSGSLPICSKHQAPLKTTRWADSS